MPGFPQVCFIKNTIKSEKIHVGDYTYYDDPENSEDFERNVLYHFPFIGDRLIIGKFCAIGRGTRFIMNGANHKLTGLSTYPFFIFGKGWEKVSPGSDDLRSKGDTCIENDVWLGYESLILPGVTVGNGAIVAARSVVTKDVPPYSIVGGNPARVVRMRFDDATIDALQKIAWWDWPIERITENLPHIVGADLEALGGTHLRLGDPKKTLGPWGPGDP